MDKTIARIGPIHGVQPIENANPITNVPIYPAGRFLNLMERSLIKNSKFNTPTITKPKNIMTIDPICLIKSWYINKYCENTFVVNPNMINTLENPSKNIIVWIKLLMLNFLSSLLNSLTLIPVIYDKNAGNNGRTQGD